MRAKSLYGRDILTISDLKKDEVVLILETSRKMQSLVQSHKPSTLLTGKIMTALFYEPSSRTFGSFISAMQRLGGGIIPLQGVAYSSVVKGETLRDTVETFSKLSDIVVIRHPQEGSARIAAEVSSVPVINAGDGPGEHPTQALLDLFTITAHFKDISKLTITFAGDLLYGRTVHSLVALLSLYQPREVRLVSPNELRMPPRRVQKIKASGVNVRETQNFEEILEDTDVLYMTRVQKERFDDPLSYERLKDRFRITGKIMKDLKGTAILLHPFPRVTEIAREVDRDLRAVYLREQIPNGMYVRMALLSLILDSKQ